MFTKIVVGIDGRDGGEDALALARQLGGEDAEILLCEVVVTGSPSRATNRDFEAAMVDEARARLADRATAPNGAVSTHVTIAPTVAKGLCKLAADEGADLIAVGSCHRGPLGRLVAGNDADAVVHSAPCPVALAPRGYVDADKRVRDIGVGFNESAESDHALALAIQLKERFDARVEVIEVLPPPWPVEVQLYPTTIPTLREEREQAEARLRANADIDESTVMLGGSPTRELRDLASHTQLLVVGARPRTSFGRAVLGTTADALTHGLHCPLIAVPRVPNAAPVVASTATS